MRPLDLAAVPGVEEPETGCQEGMTVGACVAANQPDYEELLEENPDLASQVYQVLDECYADHTDLFADIDEKDCE